MPWENDPCSREQRRLMEDLRIQKGLHYGELLDLAIDTSGRQINDIGLLTVAEASEVIDALKAS